MSQYNEFERIVEEHDKRFKRVIYPVSKIDFNFGNRKLGEILKGESIHYLACSERSLAIGYEASRNSLGVSLVALRINRPFQPVKIGCALEVGLDGEVYSFISGTHRNKLIKGTHPLSRSHKKVYRAMMIPDLDKGWFDYFEVHNLEDLQTMMEGFDAQKFLDTIRKKNEPKRVNRAKFLLSINNRIRSS